MSDQATVAPNLHFLIERAHIKCLGEKIFQGYFDTCSKQPYYDLLQKYKEDSESEGKKPTFSDFLERPDVYQRALKIVTGENQENLENGSLSQKDLEKMAKTRVNAWKKQYQFYEHEKIVKYQEHDDAVREGEINANSILSFEEFAQSCEGQSFHCLFGPYVASLKDDIATLKGFLKFCYNKNIIDLGSDKSIFEARSQNYADRPIDTLLSRHDFKTDGHTDTTAVKHWTEDTVRFLGEGLYVSRLVENGTLQNGYIAELFRQIFHRSCVQKRLLDDPKKEVELGNFKPTKLDSLTLLLSELVECRTAAAAIIYEYLGGVSLIQSYKGSEAEGIVAREVETKCNRGTQEICRTLEQLCSEKIDANRTSNANALRDGQPSQEVLDKLERFTATTPATDQESPPSSGGGCSQAVFQARFGEGMQY
jgi:hypothetical protein